MGERCHRKGANDHDRGPKRRGPPPARQAVWARPDHRGAARDTGARAVTFLQGSSRTCGWLKTRL